MARELGACFRTSNLLEHGHGKSMYLLFMSALGLKEQS